MNEADELPTVYRSRTKGFTRYSDDQFTHALRHKRVFSTGEVARICQVAPRTVSQWLDNDKLHGYRLPPTGVIPRMNPDRRVERHELIRFLRANGMPTRGLEDVRDVMLAV